MTIVANLDAAIEQHYAEIGEVQRELQIFGRVWPLVPTLMTDVVNPLARIMQITQASADPTLRGQIDPMLGIQMTAAVPEILPLVIREDHRQEFVEAMNTRGGIPVAIIGNVIEAIFTAYDALPLASATPTTPVPASASPQPASTIDAMSSSGDTGMLSNQNSNPSPPVTQPQPPIAAVPTTPQEAYPSVSSG